MSDATDVHPRMDVINKSIGSQNEGKFKCGFCNKHFSQKKSCNRHEKTCKDNVNRTEDKFSCPNCQVTFSRKDNLKVHMRSCSNVENEEEHAPSKKLKTPCLIPECKLQFFHKLRLIDHLRTSHSDIVKVKTPIELEFKTEEDFLKWKDEEEERTFSYFSQKSGQSGSTKTFFCQHDGAATVHAHRKTSRRNSKGRVKIGHFCIAQMKVCMDNLTSLVRVTYYPTHSHVCSPQDYLHHPLPKDLNSFIDVQLGEDVSPSKIHNKVKNININKSMDVQTQKINILTKKRIRERARRQRMAQRLHEDDAKSVYLMAEEMTSKENSVIIYKPYGADVVYGPENVNNLPYSNEIFMFGFQTPRQLQLMKEHCNTILIVDETHGTNQYSYKLLTCMVVDDNRRGWPVAHLITNKSDAATLKFFFEGLKERIDDPSCINCVITDDDSAIINGIEAGFSSPVRHLLCRWHVIKNLKENIRTKVPKELTEDVFNEVRVLMNIKECNMFEDLCEGFIKKYEKEEKAAKFITYFRQHYLNRTEKWAMCHRNFPHAQVNTTGHVESFHNKFKKMYLKRKVNKRLDDLISMLCDLEWEDHCNRQREALVGFSPIPQHIGERHQKSLAIPDEALVEILANTWEIKSQTKESEQYVVVCYSNTCHSEYCFVKCSQVQCDGLCSHLYTCTCPDQHSLCKHIHKLHSYLRRGKAFSTTSDFYSFEERLQSNEDQAEQDKESTNGNMAARKSSSLLTNIEHNLSILTQFHQSALDNKVSDNILVRHVNYTLTNLVNHIQMSAGRNQLLNVNEMKAAVKFNSQEKLKTQLSQLSSFKRPVNKRKRKPADCKEKKETVIRNLLDFLPESHCTSQEDAEG